MLGGDDRGTIKRSPEGVPRYDGSAETFLQYKEEAYKYMMSFEAHKRYLAGPRLVRELEGVAKTIVRRPLARDARWVDHAGGVTTLLEYLEGHLEKPSLINASRYVNKFFFGLKRKKFETMTAWVNRHSEALWEATKAMKRVQAEYGVKNASYGASGSRKASSHSSRRDDEVSEGQWESHSLPFGDDGRLEEDDEEPQQEPRRRDSWWSSSTRTWYENGWSHRGWGHYDYDYNLPRYNDEDLDCFLPDFLVGYLLLNRSGLEYQERNNVLASLRGEFSVHSVERAVKEMWSDEDLMRRDKAKGHAFHADCDDDQEDMGLAAEEAPDFGEDWQSQEAYAAAEEEALEAAATIDRMRRTLKDARQRQHELRMGRQFYRPSWKGGPGKGQGKFGASKGSHPGSKSDKAKCLKCGGDHYTSACPKKTVDEKGMTADESEAAEIVFQAEEFAGPADKDQHAFLSLSRLVKEGKGIIDCGATSSLGSIQAVEAIMKMNEKKSGSTGVSIDLSSRPIFKFGNGQRTTCVSTADMSMQVGDKKGRMSVHVHDSENQPILVSVKSLKSLGAVVDFRTGHCVFANVDPTKVTKLEEEENGHLTMRLTDDLLKGARNRKTPFRGLLAESE